MAGGKPTLEKALLRLERELGLGPDEDSLADSTTVYRMFDVSGALLYVGITGRNLTRVHQHAKAKDWWPSVARATFEHFTTRKAALKAESDAIWVEDPLHNIALRRTPPKVKRPERQPKPANTEQMWEAFDAKVRRDFHMSSRELAEAVRVGRVHRSDPRLQHLMNLPKRFLSSLNLVIRPCSHCDEREAHTKGLCQRCYAYQRKYGRLPGEGTLVQSALRREGA